jgi:hypothetical protein
MVHVKEAGATTLISALTHKRAAQRTKRVTKTGAAVIAMIEGVVTAANGILVKIEATVDQTIQGTGTGITPEIGLIIKTHETGPTIKTHGPGPTIETHETGPIIRTDVIVRIGRITAQGVIPRTEITVLTVETVAKTVEEAAKAPLGIHPKSLPTEATVAVAPIRRMTRTIEDQALTLISRDSRAETVLSKLGSSIQK